MVFKNAEKFRIKNGKKTKRVSSIMMYFIILNRKLLKIKQKNLQQNSAYNRQQLKQFRWWMLPYCPMRLTLQQSAMAKLRRLYSI